MPNYNNRKCQICADKITYIDYKNVPLLRKYLTRYSKIVPKYYNGNCLKHQKRVNKAIKQARYMALMTYTA